jgi:hypothetical protein
MTLPVGMQVFSCREWDWDGCPDCCAWAQSQSGRPRGVGHEVARIQLIRRPEGVGPVRPFQSEALWSEGVWASCEDLESRIDLLGECIGVPGLSQTNPGLGPSGPERFGDQPAGPSVLPRRYDSLQRATLQPCNFMCVRKSAIKELCVWKRAEPVPRAGVEYFGYLGCLSLCCTARPLEVSAQQRGGGGRKGGPPFVCVTELAINTNHPHAVDRKCTN